MWALSLRSATALNPLSAVELCIHSCIHLCTTCFLSMGIKKLLGHTHQRSSLHFYSYVYTPVCIPAPTCSSDGEQEIDGQCPPVKLLLVEGDQGVIYQLLVRAVARQ